MALNKPNQPCFEHPDNLLYAAAFGWMDLGNPREAIDELNEMSSAGRDQPETLRLLLDLHSRLGEWDEVLPVAGKLIELFPNEPEYWIQRAYATRRAASGNLQKAWHALRPAADQFSGEMIIPFNLACYAAQMGRLDESWSWLQRAMDVAGDVRTIKAMALADDDMKPLWDRIQAL